MRLLLREEGREEKGEVDTIAKQDEISLDSRELEKW